MSALRPFSWLHTIPPRTVFFYPFTSRWAFGLCMYFGGHEHLCASFCVGDAYTSLGHFPGAEPPGHATPHTGGAARGCPSGRTFHLPTEPRVTVALSPPPATLSVRLLLHGWRRGRVGSSSTMWGGLASGSFPAWEMRRFSEAVSPGSGASTERLPFTP